MDFYCTVLLSKKYSSFLDALIKGGIGDTAERITVAFNDDISAEINIYSEDGESYAEGILFDRGKSVAFCENETGEAFGEWDFNYNGDKYIIFVTEDEKGIITDGYRIIDRELYDNSNDKTFISPNNIIAL